MSLPKLIGILGRSRSGKDTVANIIMDLYPNYYKIYRFAQPIKNALTEIYNFTPEQLEDDQKEQIDCRYNITPRKAMQEMTMFYLDKHGPGFFSDKLFTIYDNNNNNNNQNNTQNNTQNNNQYGTIIPDVRYEHDIYQIRKRGGIILKITRPSLTVQHVIENNIIDLNGDYEIINDGDIQLLKTRLTQIFNQIL
jgi:energy-coupling factor transporter ATP-binding protein EcfA2